MVGVITIDALMQPYHDFVEEGLVTLKEDTLRERLLLASAGMAGEGGEVSDIIKKFAWHDKPIDREHVVEEMGDKLWYYVLAMKALGITWDEIIAFNVAKLKERYPEQHSNG